MGRIRGKEEAAAALAALLSEGGPTNDVDRLRQYERAKKGAQELRNATFSFNNLSDTREILKMYLAIPEV